MIEINQEMVLVFAGSQGGGVRERSAQAGASRKLRIAIADDHPLVVAALGYRLEREPQIEVIGTASDSTGLVGILEHSPCDMVITDYEMPGGLHGDGQPFVAFLRRHFPTVRVIVFTSHYEPSLIQSLRALDAVEVVNKRSGIDALVRIVCDSSAREAFERMPAYLDRMSALGRRSP